MVSAVSGAIGLAVAIVILLLMRKDRLHVSHGLGWVLVAVLFAFLGFTPWIVDYIAGMFGIASPPILALTIAISILVIKILLMDIERSKIEMRYQRLIQRIALLEAEVRSTPYRKRSDEPVAKDSQFQTLAEKPNTRPELSSPK